MTNWYGSDQTLCTKLDQGLVMALHQLNWLMTEFLEPELVSSELCTEQIFTLV